MGFAVAPGKYPFPGARSVIVRPIPADAFQPLVWGLCGEAGGMPIDTFTDATVDFQASGIQVGDHLFITWGTAEWTGDFTVGVVGQHTLNVAPNFPSASVCCHYKVGQGALHTLSTIAQIIGSKGTDPITAHWSKVWTRALLSQYNRDETGDVYVI